MKSYDIKKYKPGFEKEQEKIELEWSKKQPMPQYRTSEQLKDAYVENKLDEETSLFCFDREKMVGFVNSERNEKSGDKVRITFPKTLANYGEVRDLLYKEIIEVLRKKGVKKIECLFGVLWGTSYELAEEKGFSFKEGKGVLYGLKLSQKELELRDTAQKLNIEEDLDDCANFFVEEFNVPEEGAKNLLLAINKSELTIAQLIIREEEEIVATGSIGKNPIVTTIGSISMIHGKTPENLENILQAIIKIAQENEIEEINLHFTHLELGDPRIEPYAALGFELIGKNALFEKKLE